MLTKKLVMAAIAALGLAAVPAMAAVEYSVIELDSAPPPMRTEVVPPMREGDTWIPGYWDYRDGQYNWVGGHYETAREGYVYVAPRYEQANGRWRMYAGGWGRDEEHGGTRNRIADKIDRSGSDEEHGGVRHKLADKIRGKDDD
ncbi:MAG: hypothetical protein ACXWHA_05060 [Usitatibacter sp.]